MISASTAYRLNRANVVAWSGLAAIAVYFAVLTHAVRAWPYDEWMVLLLLPALIALGAGIVLFVTRHDIEPMSGLIIVALVLKLGASFVRYFVAFDLYGGTADASRYDDLGADIASRFRSGDLSLGELLSFGRSTEFIADLTGAIYAGMGPSRLGGFLVFAWIGFWGLFLFHRAALVGLPDGQQRRYAALLFFLPSMLFWPSSTGKEAVMMLSLGLCALGAARLCERRRRAWLPLLAGLGISYMLRPHLGAVVLGALVVAVVFRRRAGRAPVFGPVGRIVSVVVLSAGMAFVFARTVDEYLPQTEEAPISNTEAAGRLLDRAEAGTDEAGSQIERLTPSSPLEYPYAAFSVLFRPTVFEAREAGTVLAALETTFLVVLFVLARKRLRHVVTIAFRRPYVLFCIIYTAIFAFAWSSFANLGALARQRVQVWPFMLILLALPLVQPRRPEPVDRPGLFTRRPEVVAP